MILQGVVTTQAMHVFDTLYVFFQGLNDGTVPSLFIYLPMPNDQ